MILLSALLASLTGFVAGERPVERAPVELSAVVAVAQHGVATRQAGLRPENQPTRLISQAAASPFVSWLVPVLGVRAFISLKQSWLN